MSKVDGTELEIKDIGLKQGRKLAHMKRADRFAFIAEGLPLLAESALGYWEAARALSERPREADVLARHAEEEAAKALILMDIVRCPVEQVATRVGRLMTSFYDHLARLVWADSCGSCVVDLAELQSYIDLERRSHFVDGPTGADWIYTNSKIHRRESQLYVDIEGDDKGKLRWSKPDDGFGASIFKPSSLQVVEGLAHLGALSVEGLSIVAKVWSGVEFQLDTRFEEERRLTRAMLECLQAAGLFRETATNEHVSALYRYWPMPMYNLDFSPIKVPLDDLRAEQRWTLESMD